MNKQTIITKYEEMILETELMMNFLISKHAQKQTNNILRAIAVEQAKLEEIKDFVAYLKDSDDTNIKSLVDLGDTNVSKE